VDVLWPGGGVDELYAYPPGQWVRVNLVASVDGAVTLAGRSGGLSDAADRAVFRMLRGLCDVVLVGAGTVRAEGYQGVRPHEVDPALRAGRPAVPTIAVVTASCWLTPSHPLVAGAAVPPIVLTTAAAPVAARSALAAAGVPVLVAGTDRVDVAVAVRLLGERGLHRVLCEGGPALLTDLVAADLVDELCLTVSPRLVLGPSPRVAAAPTELDHRLHLASVVRADDTLLLRYLRRPAR
jgi:riboflavin biosynthesis pyrimidine reductase